VDNESPAVRRDGDVVWPGWQPWLPLAGRCCQQRPLRCAHWDAGRVRRDQPRANRHTLVATRTREYQWASAPSSRATGAAAVPTGSACGCGPAPDARSCHRVGARAASSCRP